MKAVFLRSTLDLLGKGPIQNGSFTREFRIKSTHIDFTPLASSTPTSSAGGALPLKPIVYSSV